MKPKIMFLTGPTAVGKSAVAVALARKLNARVISCDSMQIYKKMDIITSKPAAHLRKKARHYLMNIVSPTQEYDVARYRRQALSNIDRALGQKKLPLFVGGTGLYISVLIDGIFKADAQDSHIRSCLNRQAELKGSSYLYARLVKTDPEAAAKIHPNDTRRIVRALEVFMATGKPISLLQKQRKGLSEKYDISIFCLNLQRDKLYQRIDRRVEEMFRQGLLAEVKRLLRLKLSKTAECAIGIRELKGYFDAEYGLSRAKFLIKRNSRHYAKRQLTWFRKDKRIRQVNIKDEETPAKIAAKIIVLWKKLY